MAKIRKAWRTLVGVRKETCIGAGLGLSELMLVARLFSLRYRVEPHLSALSQPLGFRGSLVER